jgi:tetratricopeptide (TPR) repeat protein
MLVVAMAWLGRHWGKPEKPLSERDEAGLALAARDYPAARGHLARWLEEQPADGEARLLMARACRRDGDQAAWERHLRSAHELGVPADRLDVERALGAAQWHGSRRADQKLLDLLQAHPQDDVPILEVVVQDSLDNDLTAQVASLTARWLDRHPDDWLPYYYRAAARLRAPSPPYARIIADLRAALEINSARLDARLLLAQAQARDGHHREALADYRVYLDQRPGDPEALRGLADCQLYLSDVDGARATLDNLLAKDRTSAPAFLLLARADWVDGRPEEAMAALDQAERLAPTDLDVLRARLIVLRQLDRMAEAERCRRRSQAAREQARRLEVLAQDVRDLPERADLRLRAGELAVTMGRDAEALHWLQTALWADPDYAPACRDLADYWEKHGRPDLATGYRRRAGGLDRNYGAQSRGASGPGGTP